MSSAWEEAKQRGTLAWKAGQHQKAFDFFGEAAESAPTEELKALFSNRSAAACKLHRYEDALKEAEKCIRADRTWSKGYVRKCEALQGSGDIYAARRACNDGLSNCPGDATLLEKLVVVERALKSAAGSDSQSASSIFYSKTLSGMRNKLHMASCVALVIYLIPFISYFLPFLPKLSFMLGTLGIAVCSAWAMYLRIGKPAFTREYGALLATDPAAGELITSLVSAFVMNPSALLVMSMLFMQGSLYVGEIFNFMSKNVESIKQSINDFAGRMNLPINIGQFIQILEIFSPSQRSNAMHYQKQISSMLESQAGKLLVMQAIMTLLELRSIIRGIQMNYVFWSVLRLRCVMQPEGSVLAGFRSIDTDIQGLLSHSMCPQMVRTVYGHIKTYLASQIAPPTKSEEGASSSPLKSALSKCSIM